MSLSLATVLSLGLVDLQLWWREAGGLRYEGRLASNLSEVGVWVREHTTEDAIIATGAAGALPYSSRRWCIDLLGLTDREIARSGVYIPGEKVGHRKMNPSYVLRRGPDLVVHSTSGHFTVPSDSEKRPSWWRLTTAERALVDLPEFRGRYRPFSLAMPDGRYVDGWVRLGSTKVSLNGATR